MPARRVLCAPCALLAVAACLVAGTPRGSSASALRGLRGLPPRDSSADSFPEFRGFSHEDACEYATRAIEHCDADGGDSSDGEESLRCADGLIQDMNHEPFQLAARSCDEAFQGKRDRLKCLLFAVEDALCLDELVGDGDTRRISEGGSSDDDEQPPPAPPASWHDGDRYDYFEKTSCHRVTSSESGSTSLVGDPFFIDLVRGVANRKDCQAHCDSQVDLACGSFTHTSSHDCFLFSDDCQDPHFPVDNHFSARRKDLSRYGPPSCHQATFPGWQQWYDYQCAGSPSFTLREGDYSPIYYDYESSAENSGPYSGSLEDCQREVVLDNQGYGGPGIIIVYDRAARRCEFYTRHGCEQLAPTSSSGAVSTHLYCNSNS